MLLSYSPWKENLAPKLKNKRVLLIGDPKEKARADVGAADWRSDDRALFRRVSSREAMRTRARRL
eukprot:2947861-Pleurochrysis_carterae.AAC.1